MKLDPAKVMAIPSIRIGALAAGESAFRPLSAIAFMQVIGVHGERAARLCAFALGIGLAVALAIYWYVQLPIARFYHANRRGDVSESVARGAAAATWSMPIAIAVVWALGWATSYAVVLVELGSDAIAEAVLFIIAQSVGAFCTAHALAIWATTDTRRELDRHARAHGLSARLPASTIRGRLTIYAIGLGICASSYVAAIMLAARTHATSDTAVIVAISVGIGIVLGFGAVCGSLIGDHMARPIDELAAAIAAVAAHGTASRVERIARHERDEVGDLVEGTNEMIDRLAEAETEALSANDQVAVANAELAVRVAEASATLAREVASRAAVASELAVVERIGAALRPATPTIDGFDIACAHVTATHLFDVQGRWIVAGAIDGDGLAGSLQLVMLQSIIAALTATQPLATPAWLVEQARGLVARSLPSPHGAPLVAVRCDEQGVVTIGGDALGLWRVAAGRASRCTAGTLTLEPGETLIATVAGSDVIEASGAGSATERAAQLAALNVFAVVVQRPSA